MDKISMWPALFATLLMVALWLLVLWGRAQVNGGKKEFNPLLLTQGPFGRASLSNLQLFFFLVIVIWIILYGLTGTGELSGLSPDILSLLGIGAAGTAGAKATVTFRRRISNGNWAWIKKKEWIECSLETKREEGEAPSVGDLVSTDGQFDVTKFQAFAFTLIVGIDLLLTGLISADALASITIDQSYLALIGLSQVVYVGGKAVTPPTNTELGAEITKLRGLETTFMSKVATAWQANPPAPADMAAAKSVALTEYNAYRSAATVVAELVSVITADPRVRSLEPALPKA